MKHLLIALIPALFSLCANAGLINRGGGFIYDNVLDITWTQDANINGFDSWDNQVAWADSLSLYDSVREVTWDDWRLPNMDVNGDDILADCRDDSEADCRDNEYGYQFWQNGVTNTAMGFFSNVGQTYWAGTVYAPDPARAWTYDFEFDAGVQGGLEKFFAVAAWAVRSGDVAPAPIPVPAAAWLFAPALGLLGLMRRKAAK